MCIMTCFILSNTVEGGGHMTLIYFLCAICGLCFINNETCLD